MNVAVAVASGRADVGLGVLAAARALGLDFIPLTLERYDLVFPTDLLADERMRQLLEVIRSPQFSRQALAMGGYEIEHTGEIVAD